MSDAMQSVFDGAEEIQHALHSQAGCEMALLELLEPVLSTDLQRAHVIYAIIDSMALFRKTASCEAERVLRISIVDTH